MSEAIRYAIGTFFLATAAALFFNAPGSFDWYWLDFLTGIYFVVLGYFNIYLALGPVDWNVLFDGLLEDQ